MDKSAPVNSSLNAVTLQRANIANGVEYIELNMTSFGGSVSDNATRHNLTNALTDKDTKLGVDEMQLVKAIVLIIVIGILLISTSKIVFKTFSKFSGPKRDEPV